MAQRKVWLQKGIVLLWKIVQSLLKDHLIGRQKLKVCFHRSQWTFLDAHHWRILEVTFINEWKLCKIFALNQTVTIWNSMKVGNIFQTLFHLIQWQSLIGIHDFVIIGKIFKNQVTFALISWNISSIKLWISWINI